MSLPDFFEPLLAEQYSAADVERIIDGCHARRAVTLRANTLLSSQAEIGDALDEAAIAHRPVDWYEDAFVIEGAMERDIWQLSAYQQGKLYLQSLSSMIPPLVLEAQAEEDVLDMCAAPGGKTTQICALAQGKAHLTACEMHAPRAEKLEHNLAKLGAKNVVVMRTDARRLDDFFRFDRILIDAPCSGSGTLHADNAKTEKRFTRALIEKSRKSQKALLSKGLSLMKPGSTLIYSTCSILAGENESIVDECLSAKKKGASYEIKPIEFPGKESLPLLPSSIDGALLVCPTDLYEGFFVAKIARVS